MSHHLRFLQRFNLHRPRPLPFLPLPSLSERLASFPTSLIQAFVLEYTPFYPPIPFIRHHDCLSCPLPILILTPRHLTVREIDPELRMLSRNIFQILRRVSELERFKHEVDINLIMCLLIQRMIRERVLHVEDVAVYFLGGGSCEMAGRSVWDRRGGIPDPSHGCCEEEVLIGFGCDVVCVHNERGVLGSDLGGRGCGEGGWGEGSDCCY